MSGRQRCADGTKGIRPAAVAALTVFAAVLASAGTTPALGQTGQDPEWTKPSRHFRVERPADLSDAAALTVYLRILEDMVSGYALSGDRAAAGYRTWRRHNKAPYRSATHGERYVNNYANSAAAGYADYEDAGEMPVGAVVAKDSFAVTKQGDVFTGPLFLMEKMPEGFNPASRNWRYTMIMPDGSLFGSTGAEGAPRVEFCITCHKSAGDENDHLFFVPKAFRVKMFSIQPQEE